MCGQPTHVAPLRLGRPLVQVKTQFATQPMIYNQFLEIMKSFKSQRWGAVPGPWVGVCGGMG